MAIAAVAVTAVAIWLRDSVGVRRAAVAVLLLIAGAFCGMGLNKISRYAAPTPEAPDTHFAGRQAAQRVTNGYIPYLLLTYACLGLLALVPDRTVRGRKRPVDLAPGEGREAERQHG